MVYDRRSVFWRCAKGWLIVDILAAFPFTFMPGLGPEDVAGNHEITHLLSFPKGLQMYGLLAVVQENHHLHDGGYLALRTLIAVIMVGYHGGRVRSLANAVNLQFFLLAEHFS